MSWVKLWESFRADGHHRIVQRRLNLRALKTAFVGRKLCLPFIVGKTISIPRCLSLGDRLQLTGIFAQQTVVKKRRNHHIRLHCMARRRDLKTILWLALARGHRRHGQLV